MATDIILVATIAASVVFTAGALFGRWIDRQPLPDFELWLRQVTALIGQVWR
jgi:hypothetical protein